MLTAELTGALLAEWVARANGWKVELDGAHDSAQLICWTDEGIPRSFGECGYRPDLKWEFGGPIIERAQIELMPMYDVWQAATVPGYRMDAPTPLGAAMRAYVSSKFGKTVPAEMLTIEQHIKGGGK